MAEDITYAVGTTAYVYSQSTFLNHLAKIKRSDKCAEFSVHAKICAIEFDIAH